MSEANPNQAALLAEVERLRVENATLQAQLQEKDNELASGMRMVAAGESAAMTAHEALNPLTSVISRLQHILDEESDFFLFNVIIKAWNEEYQQGGADQLIANLTQKIEGSDRPLLEEDLANLMKAAESMQTDNEFVLKQLKRTVLILNNLRGLARAEATVIPYDVKSAVMMTEELMQDSLKKRKIEFITQFQHSNYILIDENELVQVLHNLARNAMQAIEKEGAITISTKEVGGFIEVRVQDSGPGIPAEIKDKIFVNRFTTKSKKEGTGLGLSFSRRVLQKYNGDLNLESPGGNGQGATFLCRLPVPPKK